ncbi:hypothetical protein EOA30_36375, partial [Mesorhizobium sp. M8A.F.Ca.ET.059.01.1.1]
MRLSRFTKSRKAARKQPSAASFRTEIIADVFVPEYAEDVRFFSRKLANPGRLRRFSTRDLRESLITLFYL